MTGYDELAKVIKVIDDFSFVVNRGSQSELKIGDNYLIFGLGDHLLDPDTGEDLGALEIVRGRAKVVHVQDRLATLASAEKVVIPGSKKIIRRDPRSALSWAMQTGIEEIEEGGSTRQAEINVELGDLARPV